MCIEYRTNGILPHPLPPKKNTTTTEALRNVRSKLNQNRNYIVTDRHPLTHSCPFHGGFASYQKRGSSHKNGSKQKKLLTKTKKEDSI